MGELDAESQEAQAGNTQDAAGKAQTEKGNDQHEGVGYDVTPDDMNRPGAKRFGGHQVFSVQQGVNLSAQNARIARPALYDADVFGLGAELDSRIEEIAELAGHVEG